MDQREIDIVETRVRRTLASLDDVAVPSLEELRAARGLPVWRALLAPIAAVAVLAAALVVGAGVTAWRDALATRGVASRPSSGAAAIDASKLPASRYLDVAGYRFTVSVVADAAFRATGADSAAHVSAIDGIALHCVWDRLGPDLTHVSDLIGTTSDVSSPASYDVVTSGAHADRLIGVPAAAVQGSSAAVVCGASDLYGAHGIVANLSLTAEPTTPIRTLSVFQWSGIVGDGAAVGPCNGKGGAGTTLIAAFVSNANEIATWIENAAYPDAPQSRNSIFRTGYAPDAPIYVCYYAGSWSPPVPAPIPPATPVEPGSYDRARFFVDAKGTVLYPQTIAQSAQLPLVRPGGRF